MIRNTLFSFTMFHKCKLFPRILNYPTDLIIIIPVVRAKADGLKNRHR